MNMKGKTLQQAMGGGLKMGPPAEEKAETRGQEGAEQKAGRQLNFKKDGGKVKTSGSYKGKSNALGMGGRASQMRDQGVPGAVIGAIARSKGAAPGGPNFHPGKKGK